MTLPPGWVLRVLLDIEDDEASPCTRDGCPGTRTLGRVPDPQQVPEGGVLGGVWCDTCDLAVDFIKPTKADLERGRELAEKHGW